MAQRAGRADGSRTALDATGAHRLRRNLPAPVVTLILGIIVLNESITALIVTVPIGVAITRTSDASFLF
jgi:hypothetical protein